MSFGSLGQPSMIWGNAINIDRTAELCILVMGAVILSEVVSQQSFAP